MVFAGGGSVVEKKGDCLWGEGQQEGRLAGGAHDCHNGRVVN